MDRKILKEALVGVNGSRDVDLLVSLSKQHYDELENGSGNALKECHFIDSSTALGVNFFLLYEKLHPEATVLFEWDKSSPLKVGGKSNLDIKVDKGKKVIYYESKFLEPYYMSNSRFTESYFMIENYYDHWKFTEDKLTDILRRFQSFTYYNASQLFRHLLAIVNHIIHNKDEYENVSIVELNCISWEMENEFLDFLKLTSKSKSYAIKRFKILKEEELIVKDMFKKIIEDYVSDVIPNNLTLSFETSRYNNVIDLIDNHEGFKKRYFIK